MADGFAVRPELLAAPAAAFDEAAATLRTAVAQARADLAALGDVCGDDEQGRAFASRYDPVAAEGIAAISRSVDVVASFGDGLRAVVAQYAEGDDDAADAVAGRS
ncbi:hypothetical protein [Actinomycetospora sp. TBRC 11914]|uniref:hypothetical protein n=1 Tax=Actinomycetospora sp. TBRC 11914 TaxID=2729387 RepID=UPI00145DF1BF|nr:hypothetical protein [Actinomycetospora sp. TBRC 11914]NMO88665.1 hypothetical protein [Actinomycetospora sp. TBRC 11914]